MRLIPLCRWVRFRLSTWFVLVIVLAGLMSAQPYLVFIERPHFGGGLYGDKTKSLFGMTWINEGVGWQEEVGFNYRLTWPVLTLAAFLTWKAARAIRAARLKKSQAPL